MFDFSDLRLSDFIKNYPPKEGLTLVVGFDTLHRSVRFRRTMDLDFASAELKEYPYKEQFLSEEFLVEFRDILRDYAATLPSDKQVASYLVLPDCMVTMDSMVLPQMKVDKRNTAIASHLQNIYRGYKELQINRYMTASNRQYTAYLFTIVKKSNLTALYRAMSENKLYSKGTTFTGNCLINSVLHFKPAYRKKNFLLLDIHAGHTNVAVCVKGKTAGFTSFRLGTIHLSGEKVLQENMQYDHDVADLAIINAKEKARAKQLTVAEENPALDTVADDVIQQLAEGVNRNEGEASGLMQRAEETAETAEERAIAEQFDAEDAAEEEAARQAELAQQLAEARKKKVFARKMPKRLPKFMLRPEPTDEESTIYENFRMFIKWALLYLKWLKSFEYIKGFDCVLVNMPEKYRSAIDRANSEEERSEVPFEYLDGMEEAVSGDLDMIGALYSGVYNKRENF